MFAMCLSKKSLRKTHGEHDGGEQDQVLQLELLRKRHLHPKQGNSRHSDAEEVPVVELDAVLFHHIRHPLLKTIFGELNIGRQPHLPLNASPQRGETGEGTGQHLGRG